MPENKDATTVQADLREDEIFGPDYGRYREIAASRWAAAAGAQGLQVKVLSVSHLICHDEDGRLRLAEAHSGSRRILLTISANPEDTSSTSTGIRKIRARDFRASDEHLFPSA